MGGRGSGRFERKVDGIPSMTEAQRFLLYERRSKRPAKRCQVCGCVLSVYNNYDECWSHKRFPLLKGKL